MPPAKDRAAWAAGYGATAVVLSALALRLFRLYLERADLDHGLHVAYTRRLLGEHVLLPHFAYHVLVAALSGLSADPGRLMTAASAALVLLVLAKLALSVAFARWLGARAGHALGPAAGLLLAVALFFLAPLPNWWRPENIYLGQLSPTAWHNPTVITVLPLAVATFWAFLGGGEAPRRRDDALVGLLLGISVLAKPNFALVFAPVVLLLRLRQAWRPVRLALLFAPAVVALGWQYWQAISSGLEPRASGPLSIQPLEVWRLYSPHPLASALVSLAFPLAVSAFALPRPRHGRALVAAWLVTAVAVAEFALLAEPEPRLGDANYYWGVVPAVYLLFLVSACELLAERAPRGRTTAMRAVCGALLTLHVASGVFLYLYPFQLAVAD